jgi:hypothetical protein
MIFDWTTHIHQKTFVLIAKKDNHSSELKDNLPK